MLRFLLFFLILSVCVKTEAEPIDVSPYLDSSLKEALHQAGGLPILLPISKEKLQEIYARFFTYDTLDALCQITKEWSDEFYAKEAGPAWVGTNYRFGLFDKSAPTHKKWRLIQGISCKLCKEYCDWVKDTYPDKWLQSTELTYLFDELMEIESICQEVFAQKVREISEEHPEVLDLFYSYKGQMRLPITIRLIRYDQTGQCCLPFHHDISILTLVFPSDDDPDEELLLLGPADGKSDNLESMRRLIRPTPPSNASCCGLMISGAQLPYIGVPIHPTPHVVCPHRRDCRYVLTLCCHVPNLCSSDWDTVLDTMKNMSSEFKEKWKIDQ